MIEKKRLFVAIKFTPNENYIAAFEYLRRRLRMDMISWIEPQTAHLTLKFFGNTPVERIEEIERSLNKAVENQQPFEITIDKFGAFGSSHSPKVIWAGFNENEQVIALHQRVMKAIRPIGYFPDPGNFVPHITVGRVKKMTDKTWFWESLAEIQNSEIQTLTVDKIILYESVLLKKGAQHIPIKEFPFVI
jgi:RNA 2',3'-cyclic 3'-phosphodiesterase